MLQHKDHLINPNGQRQLSLWWKKMLFALLFVFCPETTAKLNHSLWSFNQFSPPRFLLPAPILFTENTMSGTSQKTLSKLVKVPVNKVASLPFRLHFFGWMVLQPFWRDFNCLTLKSFLKKKKRQIKKLFLRWCDKTFFLNTCFVTKKRKWRNFFGVLQIKLLPTRKKETKWFYKKLRKDQSLGKHSPVKAEWKKKATPCPKRQKQQACVFTVWSVFFLGRLLSLAFFSFRCKTKKFSSSFQTSFQHAMFTRLWARNLFFLKQWVSMLEQVCFSKRAH